MPSNTLASLYGLSADARDRQVLGPEIRIEVTAIDETTFRTDPEQLMAKIRANGQKALVCLVGVQTNQFPRAAHLAHRFQAEGAQVVMGGFHVTGSMAMLPDMPDEMVDLQRAGISFFLGEAEEGRLDELIRDAAEGALKPVYDYTKDLPSMEGQPVPRFPRELIEQAGMLYSGFDLGRGCPFECSFCCIINVQGRKSRHRSPDDLEEAIRINLKMGITRFFITDDNFARNRNWEALLDRIIEIRETIDVELKFIIQVDTVCHRIPRFVDKCIRAGVDQVFVGLENINPDNLAASKKKQNKITEYREMMLAWKRQSVVLSAGYIVGFPNDTRESILRDIEVVKAELPIDMLSLSVLTPLPGSEDHARAVRRGDWLDPDLNKYDLTHSVTRHPNFAEGELDAVHLEAGKLFYSASHCRTILRRAAALNSTRPMTTANRLIQYGAGVRLRKIFTLELGVIRLMWRKDRRPGMPLENHIAFYARYYWDNVRSIATLSALRIYYRLLTWILWSNPARSDYVDAAIAAPASSDLDTLGMFTETRGGTEAVEAFRRKEMQKQAVQQKKSA